MPPGHQYVHGQLPPTQPPQRLNLVPLQWLLPHLFVPCPVRSLIQRCCGRHTLRQFSAWDGQVPQYLPQIRQQAATLDMGRVMDMVRGKQGAMA